MGRGKWDRREALHYPGREMKGGGGGGEQVCGKASLKREQLWTALDGLRPAVLGKLASGGLKITTYHRLDDLKYRNMFFCVWFIDVHLFFFSACPQGHPFVTCGSRSPLLMRTPIRMIRAPVIASFYFSRLCKNPISKHGQTWGPWGLGLQHRHWEGGITQQQALNDPVKCLTDS